MEDLKYKRNLGKFVSACNGVPELVPVKIKQEYISDENAVVSCLSRTYLLAFFRKIISIILDSKMLFL